MNTRTEWNRHQLPPWVRVQPLRDLTSPAPVDSQVQWWTERPDLLIHSKVAMEIASRWTSPAMNVFGLTGIIDDGLLAEVTSHRAEAQTPAVQQALDALAAFVRAATVDSPLLLTLYRAFEAGQEHCATLEMGSPDDAVEFADWHPTAVTAEVEAAIVEDVAPHHGIFLSRETLSEWAGFALTDEHLAALDKTLGHSSLPEVVATAAFAISSQEEDGDA